MEFNKENVIDILATLIDELHHMRRHGETDLRTVISHVCIAQRAVNELKEGSN
jgi:hypothetical protein